MPEKKPMESFKTFLKPDEVRIFEGLITENDRITFLKNLHKGKLDTHHDRLAGRKTSDEIIDHLAQHADPSTNKVNTQWIVGQYKKGHVRLEDSPRMKQTLEDFGKYKTKLAVKDINQYKHVADLEQAVEPHATAGKPVSKKEEVRQIKNEGADLVHDSDSLTVHKLKTKEAAQFYGRGTRWCTAGVNDSMFDHYNSEGPLYIVTHKQKRHESGPASGQPRKWQFHFESNQFADEQDRMVEPKALVKDMPELRNVKEFQDKSLHFNTKEGIVSKLKDIHNQPVSIKHEVASASSLKDFIDD